jgi:hypothetical protein
MEQQEMVVNQQETVVDEDGHVVKKQKIETDENQIIEKYRKIMTEEFMNKKLEVRWSYHGLNPEIHMLRYIMNAGFSN